LHRRQRRRAHSHSHSHAGHEMLHSWKHHWDNPTSHPHYLKNPKNRQWIWIERRMISSSFDFYKNLYQTWSCNWSDFRYSIASSNIDALSVCNIRTSLTWENKEHFLSKRIKYGANALSDLLLLWNN
jgi:hypothetical protein